MILYRGTDEFILDAVRKERGVLGRLILALRVMLSAPRAAKGGWAHGSCG
jgi:hypothetical protein